MNTVMKILIILRTYKKYSLTDIRFLNFFIHFSVMNILEFQTPFPLSRSSVLTPGGTWEQKNLNSNATPRWETMKG